MTNWRVVTVYVIGLLVVLTIGYDAFVIVKAGKEASISWTLIQGAYETPMIAFLAGFVCGHLFWRMSDPTKKP